MSASHPSKEEALTALLASLASANPADPSGSNEPETKAKLESIAKQLGSLLSEAPTFDPNVAGGQVLNEDGDPVVEITEHIPDDAPEPTPKPRPGPASKASAPLHPTSTAAPRSIPTPVAQEESESEEDRLRKRRERDALLDALEAEEAEEERLAQEALRAKRRNPQANNAPLNPKPFVPVPTPPAAKHVPAKSPLGQVSPIGPRIVERPHPSTIAAVEAPQTGTSKPATAPALNKQVSFAADTKPAAAASSSSSSVDMVENWGDVVPGRLRGAQHQHESLRAVHMDVVERAAPIAAAAAGPSSASVLQSQSQSQTRGKKLLFQARKVQLRQVEVDSDDELEDVTQGEKGQEDGEEDDTPDEQDEEEEDEEEEEEEEEEEDWDEAMLQRELALAYYEAQGILRGARESAEIPVAPIVSSDPGSWEQENVPLDATLASSKHRSSVSRFKAERTAKYTHSNPMPTDPFLAASLRHGKIVDGELVAGDDASDDDDDVVLGENARRVVNELMGKPTVPVSRLVNVGPDYPVPASSVAAAAGSLDPTAPPVVAASKEIDSPSPVRASPASLAKSPAPAPAPPTDEESAPVAAKKKTSRFKAALAGSNSSNAGHSSIPGSSATSHTVAAAPTPTPTPPRGVVERNPPASSSSSGMTAPHLAASTSPSAAPGPSTGRPRKANAGAPKLAGAMLSSRSPAAPGSLAGTGMVPDPWSFAPPGAGAGAGGAGFSSMVLTPEQAAAPISVKPPGPAAVEKKKAGPPAPTMGEVVMEKPMSSRGGTGAPVLPPAPPKPQRVSRFMAERR